MRFRGLTAIMAGMAVFTAAGVSADSVPAPAFAAVADPAGVVIAVSAPFAPGGRIRLTAYNSEETFLEQAAFKHEAFVDGEGLAVLRLGALPPGEYVFVAYHDENNDLRLNRGVIGRPKEPYAFSNNVRPKLKRPRFEDVKVAVDAGSVVVINLRD